MKMKLKWKRILSVVLSVVMIIGMITISEPDNVKAAGDAQNVSLTFQEMEDGGTFRFGHSELPDAYQGADDWSATVIYELQAYKDGASELQKVYLEFVGSVAYIWPSPNFYEDGAVPTQSLVIPVGTQLKESTFDNNTGIWTVVSNGKTMVLSEEMKISNENGTWVQIQSTPPKVSFGFVKIDGDWLLSHSQLDPEYQGDSNSVYYQFEAYVDGAETLETGWLEFDGDETWIWNPDGFPNETEPTTKFHIPEGSVLREYDHNADEIVADGKTLIVESDFKLEKDGATWVQVTQKEVSLELVSTNDSEWTFSRSDLPDEYFKNGDDSVFYQFEAYVDGSTTMERGWMEFSGTEVFIRSPQGFPNGTVPTNKIHIPKKTILKECNSDDGSLVTDGKELLLVEAVRLEVHNDEWKEELILPEVPEGTPELNFDFHSTYDLDDANKGWILTFDEPNVKALGEATFSTLWIDGLQKKNTVIDFPDWTSDESADWAYIYYQNFPDGIMPTTSFEIPQGTTVTAKNTNEVYVVGSTLKVIFEDGEWQSNIEVVAPPEIIAPEGTPEVLLDFKEVDAGENWTLTFDDDSLWGTGVYTAYSMIIDGKVSYEINMEFPDWTDAASRDCAYIWYQWFPKAKSPQSSLEIPKGTVLVNNNTGDLVVVAETLKVTNENGEWKSNNPEVIPDMTNDIRIKYDRFEGAGFYLDVEIVAGPDKGKNIADVYGDWVSPPPLGKITYTRNNTEEKMNVLWSPCNGNEIYISGDYQDYISELTHFSLLTDTIIKPLDAAYSQIPMRVVNDVKIQKYEEYGIWAEAGTFTDATVFNDIQISLVNSDGRGFYLKADIVEGPDKGKNIADVYGEWVAPSPSGNMRYTATENDFEESMVALWSTCNGNQIYISGGFQDFIDELQYVRFAKNTVVIPASPEYSQVPMRTVNELTLEREQVYGLWGLQGQVKTPTEFYDVTVDVKDIRGHKLVLNVKPVDASGKSIADVYGNYSSLYGAVTLTEPGVGEYVDAKTVYTIENGTFIMYDILPATKDKIEVKAGTVLLMHAGCNSSVPVRIVNSVSLSRDEEDDWTHVKGAKVTFANSPETGDAFKMEGYVVVFAVSVFAMAALWFERRRRLYGKDN